MHRLWPAENSSVAQFQREVRVPGLFGWVCLVVRKSARMPPPAPGRFAEALHLILHHTLSREQSSLPQRYRASGYPESHLID